LSSGTGGSHGEHRRELPGQEFFDVIDGMITLGTELGTSKSTKPVRGPSEATPDKRDIVFDRISHNPKVVGSNPTPATKISFLSRTSTKPATIRICGLQLGIPDLPIETLSLGLNAGAEVSPCCSSFEHKLI
jgi:hypothetical protein